MMKPWTDGSLRIVCALLGAVFVALMTTSWVGTAVIIPWKDHRMPLRGHVYEVISYADDKRRIGATDAQFNQPLHEIKMQLGCFGTLSAEERDLLRAAATAADTDAKAGDGYMLPVVAQILQQKALLHRATGNRMHDMSTCTCFDEFMGDYIMSKHQLDERAYMAVLELWAAEFASTAGLGNKWTTVDLTDTTKSLTNDQKVMRLFATAQAALGTHTGPAPLPYGLNALGHITEAASYQTGELATSTSTVTITTIAGNANTDKTLATHALALINKIEPTNLAVGQYATSNAATRDDLAATGAKVKAFCERFARPIMTTKSSAYHWEHARDMYVALTVLAMAAVTLPLRDSAADSWNSNMLEVGCVILGVLSFILGLVHIAEIPAVGSVEWPTWTGSDDAAETPIHSQFVFLLVFAGLLVAVHLWWIVTAFRVIGQNEAGGRAKDGKTDYKSPNVFGPFTQIVVTAVIDLSVIFAVAQLGIAVLAQHGVLDGVQLQTAWLVLFATMCISHMANIAHDFTDAALIESLRPSPGSKFENAAKEFANRRNGTVITLLRITTVVSIVYWWWVYGMSMSRSVSPYYKNNGIGVVFVVFLAITQGVELLWVAVRNIAALDNHKANSLTVLRTNINLLLPIAVLCQIYTL